MRRFVTDNEELIHENKKNLGDLRTALKNTEKELSGISQKLSSL